MKTSFENGTVELSDGIVISQEYTFEDFKKTSLYCGRDGILVIYLKEPQYCDGHRYLANLCFKNGKIYWFCLMCIDERFTWETEEKRKELHDRILSEEYHFSGGQKFRWGTVQSLFEPRGCCSHIMLIY